MSGPLDSDALLSCVAELSELRRRKIIEHSRRLKAADEANWDAALTAQAEAVLNEVRALGEETDSLITRLEQQLADEGYELPPRAASHWDKESARWWRKDLRPEALPVTGYVEDALENGLASLIARLPAGWWREQRTLRESLGEEYLCEPLMISGGAPSKVRQNGAHRYAYALMLAEDSLNRRNRYDIYEGAVLVPMIAAIARLKDGLAEVNGGLDRLDALPRAPSREVESRLYEMAVAARCAVLGRKVEFLDAVTATTPDLRIHDLGFPAVVECKFQRRLSEYEEQEFTLVQQVFRSLVMSRRRGLVGELRIAAREPLTSIGADALVSAADRCTGGLNPYGSIEEPWGSVVFIPLPVTIDLPAVTRLYSPDFLSWVFGWNFETTEDDGICAAVENNKEIMVGRAALPFCLKWRTEHEKILDRKARSLASLLSESIRQIPVGEAGFVYLGYEETHRDTVADRRTRRFLDLVGKWEVRKRGVNLQLIVVNRLYPSALHEGRPNLVESAMPTSPHDDNVWDGKLPSAVFVDGSGAQNPAPDLG